METFELRYFLAVAEVENIHQASNKVHVSPGSLSKAIARLEDELKTSLFSRDGRHIRLTEAGQTLRLRASEILNLEESSKLEILGQKGTVHLKVTGSEILLAKEGIPITEKLKKRYPGSTFEFRPSRNDASAIKEVMQGEAHLGLITCPSPSGLRTKTLGEAVFVTCVGPGHPLHPKAKAREPISIEEAVKYGFVSLNKPVFGDLGPRKSFDGWRDEKFPRKIEFLVGSFRVLEEIASRGLAIAYIPDFAAKRLGLETLKISGCPCHCKQTIKAVMRTGRALDWLDHLF